MSAADEIVERHQRVAVAARRAQAATPDVMQTVALLGETVEDLKARLPILRDAGDRLARIEGKLDRLLAIVDPHKQAQANVSNAIYRPLPGSDSPSKY